jgi:hypothetical protein
VALGLIYISFVPSLEMLYDSYKTLGMTTEMPPLTGTPKQIAWANDIRNSLEAVLDAELARFADDIAAGFREILHGVAARQTKADWWINCRDFLWIYLLKERNADDRAKVKVLEDLGRQRRAQANAQASAK